MLSLEESVDDRASTLWTSPCSRPGAPARWGNAMTRTAAGDRRMLFELKLKPVEEVPVVPVVPVVVPAGPVAKVPVMPGWTVVRL